MDFGHGFVPRLDKRNWAGVDRALGPPGRLPLDEPVDLPWVIVDLAWVMGKPSVVQALHAHGIKVIADSSAWRFREHATFSIDAMSRAPYAPSDPIGAPGAELRSFVEEVLRAQCRSGVDAYLVPGFVPRGRTDDISPLTTEAIETALAMTDLEPRPMVSFVGMHSEQLDAAVRLVEDLSRSVAAVYAQITPFKPQADTASKLLRCADVFEHLATDFTVVAGRAGGAGNFFRALGAHATDAGLAEGETFEFATKVRQRKLSESMKGVLGTGRRVYVPQLGLSMPGADHQLLVRTEGTQQFVRCNLSCCPFNPLDSTRTRAAEHTLRARVAEAISHCQLPKSMVLERSMAQYAAKGSALRTCNSILEAIGEKALTTKHVDHQSAAVARLLAITESRVPRSSNFAFGGQGKARG